MYCRADGVVGRCAAVDVVRSTARGQSRRRRSLCSNAAMSGFRCKLYTRCNLLKTSFVKTGTVEMTSLSSLSRWRSSWIFVGGFRRFFDSENSSTTEALFTESQLSTCNENKERRFYFLSFRWKVKRKPQTNNLLEPNNTYEYIQRVGNVVRLFWGFKFCSTPLWKNTTSRLRLYCLVIFQ